MPDLTEVMPAGGRSRPEDLTERVLRHGVEIDRILTIHRSGAAPCGRTEQLLEHRIAEIDHTLRKLRELPRTLVAAGRTDHHTPADRVDSVSDEADGVCPMIEDATSWGASAPAT